MGLDPTDPDFECGDDCIDCNPALWGDCTPKYVWANVTGLRNCPIYEGHFVPNGTWKLEQSAILPCTWEANFLYANPHPPPPNMIIRVFWSASGGAFTMGNDLAPFWLFFAANPVGDCITEFDNENICADPGTRASHEGHCTISWGPEDPCEV